MPIEQVMRTMAASTTDPSPVFGAFVHAEIAGDVRRRRVLAPKAGRALEILGHAIEYLADEYVRDMSSASAKEGTVQAIQVLMSLNREIYLSCPEVPTMRERLRALLGLRK